MKTINSSEKPVNQATPDVEVRMQTLLAEMLKEQNQLGFGSRLSQDRQEYYSREAEFLFRLLGFMNPFTVDPRPTILAFDEILREVDSSNW
jgi:hypothetical protein